MKLFLVAGARPNFMKIAPIIRELKVRSSPVPSARATGQTKIKEESELEYKLVHTGQHYDYEMSQAFFDDLELPKPDFFLEAGSSSHAEQTSKVMMAFEDICLNEKPDLAIVVGDVNSTMVCSIVAKKLFIKVAHVEAGLSSFDLTMPEEINRIVTDSISDYFFVTEKSAIENLLKEGKPKDKIHFVGNVMIDNLLYHVKRLHSEDLSKFSTYDLKRGFKQYIFLTLHRPSNVDSQEKLGEIVEALDKISANIPIIFTAHPRTKKNA